VPKTDEHHLKENEIWENGRLIIEMLRFFHVKILVLSAIPELVNTWVSGFGFKPIEEYERKHLDTINLLLLPGTSLLTKSLDHWQ